MVLRSLAATVLGALLATLAFAQDVTTVILVRHAERASTAMSDKDMGLSAAGAKRAQLLAHMLSGAHVQAIYTSALPRTIQTAQPLAKELNLTPSEITDVATLVADIKSHPGRTALVVHHSNTVPKIMEGLGVRSAPSISDSQFDWFFIVTIRAGDATLLSLHYGE